MSWLANWPAHEGQVTALHSVIKNWSEKVTSKAVALTIGAAVRGLPRSGVKTGSILRHPSVNCPGIAMNCSMRSSAAHEAIPRKPSTPELALDAVRAGPGQRQRLRRKQLRL